jgi:uncharacterized protein (DUF885 family)
MRNWTRALLAAASIAFAGCPPVRPPAAELDRLAEAYWDEKLALNPIYATFLGDHRFDDRLERTASPEYRERSLAMERRWLAAVRAIDPVTLDEEHRLTRDLFIYNRERDIEEFGFPGRLVPISQFDGGMSTYLPVFGNGSGAQPFATVADYDRWLSRAQAFPAWADDAIAAMREGMARGVVHPQVVMSKVVTQFEDLLAAEPERSVFWGPIEQMPRDWPAAERTRLTQAFVELIERDLNPSYRRLRDFIRDEYLPHCRSTVGWSALPDGARWYASRVRRHTTTRMSPGEIHEVGLAEVARIRAGMEEVVQQVGFKGSLSGFFRHVQKEPAFYFAKPADVLAGFRRLKAQVEGELPRLFAIRPKADYEIREVESFRAASAAGGSYFGPSADGTRPGIFYVNTYNLKAQPIYGMETLSLHEAEPGHHFQTSIALELTGVPRFRRAEGNVAYEEGWALYAESLGRELGLFTDPMQWYGRLSDEMLRAMRLVVDTGLHAKGWTREQAIAYMRENSSMADTDIEAEVERYIVEPGQALGYKIGELRIQALRRRAAAALGSNFDLREFHTAVLEGGALPMDVLEAKIGDWVERRRAPGGA